jgi:hypothetical protein
MFAASKTDSVSAGSTLDAQFNYVTMLLHGDGTNGAQNNTFLDSGPNTFSITRNGNTTQGSFSPYGSNWSNYFAYNSTAANYLTTSSVSLSGTFTIEGYVYWDGVGSNANMFTLGDSSLSTGLEVYISGGNWVMWSNAAQRIAGSAAVVGQWTYISISRTGSTVTMYINGASQGTWTSSATFSGTIKVGAEFYSGVYYSSMSGYISNFRVNNTTAINAVPTTPLTAVSGTIFLTCQSNRFIDNSASPLTITVNGTPSVQRFNPFGASTAYSTSVIGGSGYFDGSDNLTVPDNSAFDYGSGDFTLECWIYPTTTMNGTLITAQTSGANYGPCNLYFNSGALELYSSSNNSSFDVASGASVGTPVVNQWSHVAVSRSGTSIRCFLNGTLTSTTTSSATLMNATGTFQIASRNDTEYYSGYISNFRVVKGTAVYTAAFTPPTAPLTAISGTSLLVNMTNGAIFDNAMMNDLETVGNAQISTSVKKYGTGSLAFDGTGDRLVQNATPNVSFGTGDFTIEAWIYSLDVSDSTQRGWLQTSSTAGGLATGFTDGVTFVFGTPNGSGTINAIVGGTNYASSGGAVSSSTWTHIAVTRASGAVKLFVNGTSVASGTGNTTNLSGQFICVGGYYSTAYLYNGYIDDFRITKGYARYTANFTAPTSALSDTGPY